MKATELIYDFSKNSLRTMKGAIDTKIITKPLFFFYVTLQGFAFLLHFCEQVSVFELIPSMDYRERQPCYYFDEKESDFCFMNGYHPKKAEISMLLGLNVGGLDEVFRDGYATVPGLTNLDCSDAGDGGR